MRILITAGPTREYLDSVRFISNASSGRMGFAIAAAAAARGHQVVLIAGPVAIDPPSGVDLIRVTSAAEMARACKRVFGRCDAAIFTAAVSDYRPEHRAPHKLKKALRPLTVRLVPTEDIAAALGRRKRGRVTITFAMEDHDPRRHAADKLVRKRCDAVVLNGPENIGGPSARVEVLLADGRWIGPWKGSKRRVAERIVRLTETLAARPRTPAVGPRLPAGRRDRGLKPDRSSG